MDYLKLLDVNRLQKAEADALIRWGQQPTCSSLHSGITPALRLTPELCPSLVRSIRCTS